MKNNKTISVILIIAGAALLLGVGFFTLDKLTSGESVSLGTWIFNLLGAGSLIKGWLDLFKKEKPAAPNHSLRVNTVTGGVVASEIGTLNYHEAEKIPETHDSIGYVPSVKAYTYIHRGKTEDDVIEFLRKGGVGAIIGLHAPGGLGKTELSKKACDVVRENYDGVLWVDVSENTPAQVVTTMLLKCGVQLPPGADDETAKNELRAYLQMRKLLVILDDVREKALQGLNDFLPPKPCSCLMTSRIQQMSGIKTFALDHMSVEQARELMRAILGDEVVEKELDTADKLAERAGWNPLALEIAARRILQERDSKAKPIKYYFELAKNKFPELQMDGDARWDMRKIFDISYQDLSPVDQKRFRALAVFDRTGFSPQAVSAVWQMDETDTKRVLSRFINLSLVKPVLVEQIENAERYRFHDLIDEYAALLLEESAEGEGAYSALAQWLVDLFEEHYTDDFSNAPKVGLEFTNLAKIAEWALSNKKGEMLAMLATKPRNWLYNYYRQLNDWLRWLEGSLKIGVENKQLQANVRKAIGDVQQFRKETDAAIESYNEALKLFKAVGDKLGEANVRKAIGDVQQFRKETDAPIESYNEALKLFKAVGAKLGEANVLAALCRVSVAGGDIEKAEIQMAEIIKMRREIKDIYSEGADYGNFAITLLNNGHKEKAKEYALKAKDAFEKVGEPGILKQVDQLIAACDEA